MSKHRRNETLCHWEQVRVVKGFPVETLTFTERRPLDIVSASGSLRSENWGSVQTLLGNARKGHAVITYGRDAGKRLASLREGGKQVFGLGPSLAPRTEAVCKAPVKQTQETARHSVARR